MSVFFCRHRLGIIVYLLCSAWLHADEPPSPAGSVRDISVGSLRGILQPVRDLSIPSRASGIVEKLGPDEGQQVEQGTILLQLNADIERAEVASAEAVLESCQAELDRTKRELDRMTILQNDSIGSKKDFEDAQLAHVLARAKRKQAVANLDSARTHLAERSIVAPFSGLMFKRTRQIGEAVDRLEPVVRLVDASRLVLVIYAGPELLGRFHEGQTASLAIDSGPSRGSHADSTVTYVDPILDPETATFRIRLELPLTNTIQPGMSATLQLPPESH